MLEIRKHQKSTDTSCTPNEGPSVLMISPGYFFCAYNLTALLDKSVFKHWLHCLHWFVICCSLLVILGQTCFSLSNKLMLFGSDILFLGNHTHKTCKYLTEWWGSSSITSASACLHGAESVLSYLSDNQSKVKTQLLHRFKKFLTLFL